MPISDLNPADPAFNAPVGLGDDEIRAVKQALIDSWGGIDGLVTSGTASPAATAADMIGLFDELAALNQGVGSGFIGEVRMLYADPGVLPAGWYVCDGGNGTPDFRGKFAIGGDSVSGLPTYQGQSSGGQSGSGATGLSGDGAFGVTVPDHTIGIANVPEHNHTLFGTEANNSAGGNVIGSGQVASADVSNTSANNQPYQISPVPTNPSGVEPTAGRSGKAGQGTPSPLTHAGSQVVLPGHTHDLTGALPPWRAVYYIMYTGV